MEIQNDSVVRDGDTRGYKGIHGYRRASLSQERDGYCNLIKFVGKYNKSSI